MSKNNIKSVVEITEEDVEIQLDKEYKNEIIKESMLFHKECDLNNKCINIHSDIKSYLNEEALSDKICVKMDVDNIKQLLSEIYS